MTQHTNLTTVEGEVRRVLFGPDPRTGFTIFILDNPRCTSDPGLSIGTGSELTVKGSCVSLKRSDTMVCEGDFIQDPKYGRQFKAAAVYPGQPDTRSPDGVAAYLVDAVKGIGKTLAKRIVKAFGSEHVFDVFDHEPERLLEVKGITESKLKSIKRSWHDARGSYLVMTFLRGLGIGPELSHRAYMHLGGPEGADVVGLIKQNPYRLVEVPLIGFKKADDAALAIGIAPDSPFRIEACAMHLLQEHASEGNTYMQLKELGRSIVNLLQVDRNMVANTLLEATSREDEDAYITIPHYSPGREWDRWVMLPMLYACERGIVNQMQTLLRGMPHFEGVSRESLDRFAQDNFRLDDDQESAARMALTQKFSILTGGPGMGKTAITKFITQSLLDQGANILQVAPTGRAAKQLRDATGVEAMTIHRYIGKVKAARDADDEEAIKALEFDVAIMDETSMTDTWLMYQFLKYLPSKAIVMLVGDIDQLASVGPGNVLGDLIDSDMIPVSRLTKVYRQGDGSGVAAAARDVIMGVYPTFTKDFRFTPVNDPADIAALTVAKVCDYLNDGIDISEIQVLSPMYKSEVGVTAMNNAIQKIVLPEYSGPKLKIFDYEFCVGDKVLQNKNNQKLDIVNGDIGFIRKIVREDDETFLHIQFDDRYVEMKRAEANDLTLAYAMSIHKSQGGQFSKVIMPMHMSQYAMLQRNLLYTGITRAKEEVDIFGEERALKRAVKTEKNSTRQTGLKQALLHLAGLADAHTGDAQ